MEPKITKQFVNSFLDLAKAEDKEIKNPRRGTMKKDSSWGNTDFRDLIIERIKAVKSVQELHDISEQVLRIRDIHLSVKKSLVNKIIIKAFEMGVASCNKKQ